MSSFDWPAGTSTSGITSVADTDSVDLTKSSSQLSADVKLSSNAADSSYQKVNLNIESTGVAGLRAQIPDSSILERLSATSPITYNNSTGEISSTGIALQSTLNSVSGSLLSDIAQNASDITTASGALRSDITTNTADISINAGDIATNVSDISGNVSDITSASGALRGDVDQNATDISSNASDITTVSGLVDDNASDITSTSGTLRTDVDAKVSKSGDTMTGTLEVDTIEEAATASGVLVDGVRLLDSFIELDSISEPATPATDDVRLFAVSGSLMAKSDSGETWNLTPTWQDWSPTSGADTGSWSATITAARYFPVGKFRAFVIDGSGASPSNNTDYLTLTLPSNLASLDGVVSLQVTARITINGTSVLVATYVVDGTDDLLIYSDADFGGFLSSDTIGVINIQGFYESE